MNWKTAGPCSDAENVYEPEDPEAWCKEQVSWLNPTYAKGIGLECTGNQEWNFVEAYGKVLTMYYVFQAYRGGDGNSGNQYPSVTCNWNNDNINKIATTYNPPTKEGRKYTWYYGTAQLSFLFNREVDNALNSHAFTCGVFNLNQRLWWCGWTLEDAGNYAVSRQMTIENRFEEIQKEIVSRA